ncbi:MAG TPA: 2'-5' RNA ligase family protein, partial [Flavisolibacter sp.]|nr:2'-5' RNA ligase family protein [Flavisolibacter sp.]
SEWIDYEVVVVPDDATHESLRSEQQFFHESFLPGNNFAGDPHISIARFQAKEIMEETLVRWIKNICLLHSSFEIRLNNFSSLPPHTIYLRILDPLPITHIGNQLKMISAFIESNNCPPITLSSRPHLAIASGLSECIYEKAVREYAQRCFSQCFTVEKLVLLKKEDVYGPTKLVSSFRLATAAPEE